MTFMRSKSGISNYAIFKQCKVTAYIEGKFHDKKANVMTPDEIFYKNLFRHIAPETPIATVVLGSKKDVLAYSTKIRDEKIANAITIIDKDLSDVLPSNDTLDCITTYGYSWENDFWTEETCVVATRALSSAAANPEQLEEATRLHVRATLHALEKLSKVDALSKVHGEAYLPGDKPGIPFVTGNVSGLSIKDIRGMRKRIPNTLSHSLSCNQCMETFQRAMSAPGIKIIQGHRWEHFCLNRLADTIEANTHERHKHASIKAVALAAFSAGLPAMIAGAALAHYQSVVPDAIDKALRRAA
jgi:hypothetical protein